MDNVSLRGTHTTGMDFDLLGAARRSANIIRNVLLNRTVPFETDHGDNNTMSPILNRPISDMGFPWPLFGVCDNKTESADDIKQGSHQCEMISTGSLKSREDTAFQNSRSPRSHKRRRQGSTLSSSFSSSSEFSHSSGSHRRKKRTGSPCERRKLYLSHDRNRKQGRRQSLSNTVNQGLRKGDASHKRESPNCGQERRRSPSCSPDRPLNRKTHHGVCRNVDINEQPVGFCDCSMLFCQDDESVIIDNFNGRSVVPIYAGECDTHYKVNPNLSKHLIVGNTIRGVVTQYIRSLHALEVKISAIEDASLYGGRTIGRLYNDEDRNDQSAIAYQGVWNVSNSITTVAPLTSDIQDGVCMSNAKGLYGLLLLSRDGRDEDLMREFFFLRANELEKVQGLSGELMLVPKPGVSVRLPLVRPDHPFISDLQKFLVNDNVVDHGRRCFMDERKTWLLNEDSKIKSNKQSQELYGLKIIVLASLRSRASSRLPTGFFSNCRDFGILVAPVDSFPVRSTSRENPLQRIGFTIAKENATTHSNDKQRTDSGHPNLLHSIMSDLKFSNPQSHHARLKDLKFSSFGHSTLSLLPILPLSSISSNPSLNIDKQSLAHSLYQLQKIRWASQYVRQGVRNAKDGHYHSAIEQYNAALQNVPNYTDALVARGAARANMKQYDSAIADFNSALQEDPNNENAQQYKRKTIERKLKLEFASQKGTENFGLGYKSTGKDKNNAEFLLDWKDEQERLLKYRK